MNTARIGAEPPQTAQRSASPVTDLPGTESVTDATRHVCAGIYEDRLFGARLFRTLIDDEHHAIGPAPGVDLRTIAQHAVAARRFALRDDLLVSFAVAVAAISLALEADWLLPFAIVVVVGLCVHRQWSAQYGPLARLIKRGRFVTDPLDGKYSPQEWKQLSRIDASQSGNAIVYAGFSPFLGSGIELHGWSFTIDLTQGSLGANGDRAAPLPIDILELYDDVEQSIRATGVEGLELHDYVFVNGRDIRDDERFLSNPFGPPEVAVDDTQLETIITHPTTKTRHYKCARIVEWEGALVLSAFFRFAKTGESLFAEASFWLLTPVRESYRAIDNRADQPTARQAVQLVVSGVLLAPFLAVFAPFSILERVTAPWRRWRAHRALRKQMREQPLYDYGARESVREMAASGQYQRYFQKLDKEMFFKVAQRAILDALTAHLEANGVDTSDLSERRTTIFNSGVIVSGGTMQADAITVGRGAKTIAPRFVAGRTQAKSA